ncbi:MAG: DUF5685 family protein [bacterium]
MFGYIVYNQKQMSEVDLETYRSYYCGLCKCLARQFGLPASLTLSNDMTFLTILLSGLYEPDDVVTQERCMIHPLSSHQVRRNRYIEYGAHMTILMAYYKSLDDIKDEHKHHLIYHALKKPFQKIQVLYPRQIRTIEEELEVIARLEKDNSTDLDALCNSFGRALGGIFMMYEDIWADELYEVGYQIGRFIYLLDAYDDLDDDLKHHQFNALRERSLEDGFEDDIFDILEMFMSEATLSFETLPIIRNREILRNILYSGVWARYNGIRYKDQKGES